MCGASGALSKSRRAKALEPKPQDPNPGPSPPDMLVVPQLWEVMHLLGPGGGGGLGF